MKDNSKRVAAVAHASSTFSPRHLISALLRAGDGTVYVDTNKLRLQAEDRYLFWCIAMRHRYGWDYRNPESSTAYLSADGDIIRGGIYDTRTGAKLTSRVIASTEGRHITSPYIYSQSEMERLQEAIKNT